MKVVAILQARMNSTRLPGKMLLDLAGAPLVQRVIERVQRATRLNEVVLAFPVVDYPAFSFLHQTGASLYGWPGNEHDLVARYLGAAEAYGADIIVRIPCDNPCVEPEYIDEIVRIYMENCQPFYSNTTSLAGDTYVDGLGAEVFSVSRLKWLDQITKDRPDWREHPHKYFYDTSTWRSPDAQIRLDVNTQADYEFIRDIYDHLHPINPHFGIHDILTHLEVHGRAQV